MDAFFSFLYEQLWWVIVGVIGFAAPVVTQGIQAWRKRTQRGWKSPASVKEASDAELLKELALRTSGRQMSGRFVDRLTALAVGLEAREHAASGINEARVEKRMHSMRERAGAAAEEGHVEANDAIASNSSSPVQRPLESFGKFYFAVPEKLKAFVTAKATIEILGGAQSDTAHAEAMRRLATDRAPVSGEIETTSSMIVELHHDAEAIRCTLKSPRRQPVRVGKTTRWEWDVVGLKRGRHEISARFQCVCEDGEYETHPETAAVNVTVNVVKSAKDSLKWLCVVAVAALAGGVYAETRKPIEQWVSSAIWNSVNNSGASAANTPSTAEPTEQTLQTSECVAVGPEATTQLDCENRTPTVGDSGD